VNVEFGLTTQQTMEILNSAVSEFKYGEHDWRKYWVSDFDETYAYVYDYEEEKMFRCTYTVADNVASVDVESKTEVIRGGYEVVGEEKGEQVNYEIKYNELKPLYDALEIKCSTFEKVNEKLKEYKVNVEGQQVAMSVEGIIAKFSKKIPKEKVEELREKGKSTVLVNENGEVENLAAFENEVKAVAFDYVEDKKNEESDIDRMDTHVNEPPAVKKFW
jgi:hypothetical protein